MIDDDNEDDLSDRPPTRAEIQAVIDRLVAEGRVHICGHRDGKPAYAIVPDKKQRH
jgi:hypothetical protein